ncbi:MAG TPA: hypothetical protein VK217_11345, partial [Acidimicrobiales bacterium]|nr:hypothetical protein [Acidimicrobiales bacterium]
MFTRAPCTRIDSWLSATCGAGDRVLVLVPSLIASSSVRRGHSSVLEQPEDVAVGVGEGGHQAPATHVVR